MVTKQCQMRLLAAGVVAVAMLAVATDLATLYAEKASAAADTLTVTGVATNHSSAKVYFQPVAGARDYRIYDAATPTDVKYAGMAHLTASAACPGPYCLNHFVAQADGATPVFPYQVVDGPTGGPQVLDVPATDIEWNSLGDRQPHTLVVEAVDQLGPVPQANTYTGLQNLAILSPSPPGAMLGSNRGRTADGNSPRMVKGPSRAPRRSLLDQNRLWFKPARMSWPFRQCPVQFSHSSTRSKMLRTPRSHDSRATMATATPRATSGR